MLRPRWILSHLLVALLVVVMVNLGFWQLRRLDERRDENALIEARADQPAVAIDRVLRPSSSSSDIDGMRFRTVTAEGRYDDGATVQVRNRTQNGVAGDWVVTPLVLGNGDRVPVIRGFVGLGPDGDPAAAPVPSGEVTVKGAVMVPKLQDRTVRKDLSGLLQASGTVPALVRAEKSSPKEPAAPKQRGDQDARLFVLEAPALSEGPHMSYAVQWFIFSTIALVGYPLILRRVLQRRGKEVDADADG